MRHIDLTMNGDFSEKVSLRTVSNNVKNTKKQITDSEINSNFLTGSIDEINNNTTMLRIIRSVEEIEPLCMRCGGTILFKDDEICERCNQHMDQEHINNKTLSLLKSECLWLRELSSIRLM